MNSSLNIKVIDDNFVKFVDTEENYTLDEEVVISDIDIDLSKKILDNKGLYALYKNNYFKLFNSIKKIFNKRNLNNKISIKIKNNNAIISETIINKIPTSYLYKDKENNFKNIFSYPVLKNDKVFGVVLIDTKFIFEDYESASQSILLTNFFLFFISIMFFLSFLFSRSIIKPIKILSHNTNLERDRYTINKKIINYPNRNDEIGILSKDIKSMSADLKKRIIELEEFSSDVSHELKNPLAGLKSSSDLLQLESIDQDTKKILFNNMSSDINRMNILISDISNYTLTQVEMSEEYFEDIELIYFLNEFKNSQIKRNYKIIINSEEKKIFLKINKNKFIQVLYSLLDNASSHISNNSKILFYIKIKNQSCVLHFVDQGIGISLDYGEKIFERFYSDRKNNRHSHSGLGLSISRKIIEGFGGKINLVKNLHKGFQGACFEIKLPLKDLKKK